MTDQQLEQRLRTWYRAEIGEADRAPAALRASVAAIPHAGTAFPRRMTWRFPTMNMATRFAVAAVIGIIAVGGAMYLLRATLPSVGNPSPTPALSSNPSQPASPTSSVVPARAASWTATGSMTTPRSHATAVLLATGKVLVFGGGGSDNSSILTSAELYDTSTGIWTSTGSMVATRVDPTTTLLRDGRVLVTGGEWNDGSSAELYDPGSGRWTATGHMITPRGFHSATLLPSGKVLVAGGQWGAKDLTLDSAELYDPSSGTWTATGRMLVPGGGAATMLHTGKVLVAGGYDPAIGALSSAELYDPATGTWTITGSMVNTAGSYWATLLPDGRVLVVGEGRDGPSVEIYDARSESWSPPPAGTWTYGGDDHLIVLPDGRLLLLGVQGHPATETYDPSRGTWIETAGMGRQTAGYTATLLADGRVLVAGGGWGGSISEPAAPAATGPTIVASAEIYDPGSP